MEIDEDDLPAGFPSMWDVLVEHLRTFWVTVDSGSRSLGLAMSDPDTAKERRNARYKTERWKEQHRKAAREYARKKRAKLKAAQSEQGKDRCRRKEP